jgi:hypothetical protein
MTHPTLAILDALGVGRDVRGWQMARDHAAAWIPLSHKRSPLAERSLYYQMLAVRACAFQPVNGSSIVGFWYGTGRPAGRTLWTSPCKTGNL